MNFFSSKKVFLSVLILAYAVPAVATEYAIDEAHSSVSFKIRHLLGKVPGKFNRVNGKLTYEPNKPESWKVEATIDAASVDTGNSKRDEHLRSDDFFDVKKYPQLTFKSEKVEKVDGNTAELKGTLTMHGVSKPVTLKVEINGTGPNHRGIEMAAFSATGKLNRNDFGVNYNKKLTQAGDKLMLGEEVELAIEIEAEAQSTKTVKSKLSKK